MPGCWGWMQDRYLWRPGYWIQTQPDWIWMPSRYVPTPNGYVYIDGYWDYPLARRGLTFAPVVFAPTVLARPSFSYTPVVALAAGGLLANLFIRPATNNYYFGDYYTASGRGPGSGYVPWFGHPHHRSGYDPLYAQMAAVHRHQEPNWDRRIREDYQYRFDHHEARPAPTFVAERARFEQRQARGEQSHDHALARPLHQMNQGPNPERRLVAVEPSQRAEFAQRQAQIHQFREARVQQEAAARRPANVRPEDHRPHQIPIARSPIVAAGAGHKPQGPNPVAASPAHPEQHHQARPALQPAHQAPGPHPAQPHPHPNPAPIPHAGGGQPAAHLHPNPAPHPAAKDQHKGGGQPAAHPKPKVTAPHPAGNGQAVAHQRPTAAVSPQPAPKPQARPAATPAKAEVKPRATGKPKAKKP